MKKFVTIIVQNHNESAEDFGDRLNSIIDVNPKFQSNDIQFTTASDGRQTANIIFTLK